MISSFLTKGRSAYWLTAMITLSTSIRKFEPWYAGYSAALVVSCWAVYAHIHGYISTYRNKPNRGDQFMKFHTFMQGFFNFSIVCEHKFTGSAIEQHDFFAPSRTAVRAESMAVFPPPITATTLLFRSTLLYSLTSFRSWFPAIRFRFSRNVDFLRDLSACSYIDGIMAAPATLWTLYPANLGRAWILTPAADHIYFMLQYITQADGIQVCQRHRLIGLFICSLIAGPGR